jgi:hypothetical protein
MRFTPNQNFECPDLQSSYVVGLSYNCLDDDDAYAKLRETLPIWLEEGKVRLGVASQEDIQVLLAGSGNVN